MTSLLVRELWAVNDVASSEDPISCLLPSFQHIPSTCYPQFVHNQLYRAPGILCLRTLICCLALGCSGTYLISFAFYPLR
jgi:hypothetical protein